MKNVLIGLIAIVFLSACATRVSLTPTDRVPAAVATMKLATDKNDNTTVKLDIQHLAPPEKLRGDLTVYVVWVRDAAAADWKNVGQLLVNEDREGSREFSVSSREFDIIVSAETDGDATTPGEHVVLEGHGTKK